MVVSFFVAVVLPLNRAGKREKWVMVGNDPVSNLGRSRFKLYHEQEANFCALCSDLLHPEVDSVPLPCKHEFHHDCLRSWIQTHAGGGGSWVMWPSGPRPAGRWCLMLMLLW